jgi:hypothetical protein
MANRPSTLLAWDRSSNRAEHVAVLGEVGLQFPQDVIELVGGSGQLKTIAACYRL